MAKRAQPELWIKLTLSGEGQVGPGKIELLRRIREHRSIAAAARSMDMSYRRAWLLVEELNRLFAEPVVAKWHGGKGQGGAALTEFGQTLVRNYDLLVQRATEVNKELLAEIGRCAAGPLAGSRTARDRPAGLQVTTRRK